MSFPPIEIFRAGKRVTNQGESVDISEIDLEEAVAAYDPALHEAPLVIGHPRTDSPAYGWVGKLLRRGASLFAEPAQVDPTFAEGVQAGRYKKVSASFYRPDSPANPTPGRWYLRHVGFLGAKPPAVKGLTPVHFAEDEDGAIEFAEVSPALTDLLRGLREFLISKYPSDLAGIDRALPSYLIDSVVYPVQEEPQFSENGNQAEDEDLPESAAESAAESAELIALRAENARLKAELLRTEFAEFAEQNVERIGPGNTELLVSLLETVHQVTPVEFAEQELSPVAALKRFVSSLPAAFSLQPLGAEPVEFAESDPVALAKSAAQLVREGKAATVIEALKIVRG